MAEKYSVEAVLKASGASSFVKQFETAKRSIQDFEKTGRNIKQVGKNLEGVGKGLTKRITKPAIVATTAIGGIVTALGFKRLVGIDSARAKLKGLGHDGKSIEAIMNSALDAVKGTSFGMDEAATTAATAVAAGVDPVKELTRYLTLTGDAAAIADVSLAEMGSILNKVKTSNKAYNGELQQLSDKGLPVYQWLAEEAGVAADAVFDLASEGQISSEMLMNAIENNIGGAAKKIGEDSFTAGIANMWAAVGRLGAAFLDAGGKGGGFFSKLKPMISDAIEHIDKLAPAAERWGEMLGTAFTIAVEKGKELKGMWDDLSEPVKDVSKQFALWGSVVLIAAGPVITIVGKIISIIGTLWNVLSKLRTAFLIVKTIAVAAFGSIGAPVWIAIGIIAAAAALVYAYWEPVKEFFINLWETIKETAIGAWGAISDFLQPAIQAIVDFAMEIWSKFTDFWQEHGEMIMEATMNVWNVIETVITTTIEVIVTIVKWLADAVWTVMQFIWPVVKFLIVDTWNAIKNVIKGAIDVILGIIQFFAALFTGNWSDMWEAVKKILSGIVQALWGLINLWFVGKIMKIGKTFFKLFQNLFKSGWNIIKSIFNSSLNAVRNVVSSVFNAIRSIIGNIMNGVKGVISSITGSIKNRFTSIFNSLKSVVSGAMNGVKTAVSNGIKAALNVITNMSSQFLNAGKNIVSSIVKGITGSIGSVGKAIGSIAGKVRDFLPFSPAKEGPLKDIMKIKIGESIAESIKRGQGAAYGAMDTLSNGLNKKMNFNGRLGEMSGRVAMDLTAELNANKKPAIINVHVGNELIAKEIVDDITKYQNRKMNVQNKFRGAY